MLRLWSLCGEGEAVSADQVQWRINDQRFQTLLQTDHPDVQGYEAWELLEGLHIVAVEKSRPPGEVLLHFGKDE